MPTVRNSRCLREYFALVWRSAIPFQFQSEINIRYCQGYFTLVYLRIFFRWYSSTNFVRRRKRRKTTFHVERDRKWQNVDVRYIYFGRNTARLMSSSIFKIGSRLDSSFEIVWRLLDDSLRTRNSRGDGSSSRRLNNGLSRLFIFSPFFKKSLMFSLSFFFLEVFKYDYHQSSNYKLPRSIRLPL